MVQYVGQDMSSCLHLWLWQLSRVKVVDLDSSCFVDEMWTNDPNCSSKGSERDTQAWPTAHTYSLNVTVNGSDSHWPDSNSYIYVTIVTIRAAQLTTLIKITVWPSAISKSHEQQYFCSLWNVMCCNMCWVATMTPLMPPSHTGVKGHVWQLQNDVSHTSHNRTVWPFFPHIVQPYIL